jgi:hypothetical protein
MPGRTYQAKTTHTKRFVAVLEIPPVTSAETAVKVAIASEVKQARKGK